jgi:hypothetical protein
MRWFNKAKPKEPWDEGIDWPIDDLEATRRIRLICNAAVNSAEKVGHQHCGAGAKADSFENERYQRAAKAAMEIAMNISDDPLRDSAVCHIVALCLTANDLRTAAILFRAVLTASIREDVLKEYPALRAAIP